MDVVPRETNPFIEIIVDAYVYNDDDSVVQLVTGYGRIHRRINELHHIPIGSTADDGVVDNHELMSLVSHAAITWVAREYNTTVNSEGKVVIR